MNKMVKKEYHCMSIFYTNEINRRIRKQKAPIIFIPEELMKMGKKMVFGTFVYSGGVFDFVVDKVVDCDEVQVFDKEV